MGSYHDFGQKKISRKKKPSFPHEKIHLAGFGQPTVEGGIKHFQNNLGLIPLNSGEPACDDSIYKNKKKKSYKSKHKYPFTVTRSKSDRRVFMNKTSSQQILNLVPSFLESRLNEENIKVKNRRTKNIFIAAVCVIVLFTLVIILIIVFRDLSPGYVSSKQWKNILNASNNNSKELKCKSYRRKSRKIKKLLVYNHTHKNEVDEVSHTYSQDCLSNNNNKMASKGGKKRRAIGPTLEDRLEADGNHAGKTVLRKNSETDDETEDPFMQRLNSGGFMKEYGNIVKNVKADLESAKKKSLDEFAKRLNRSKFNKDESSTSSSEAAKRGSHSKRKHRKSDDNDSHEEELSSEKEGKSKNRHDKKKEESEKKPISKNKFGAEDNKSKGSMYKKSNASLQRKGSARKPYANKHAQSSADKVLHAEGATKSKKPVDDIADNKGRKNSKKKIETAEKAKSNVEIKKGKVKMKDVKSGSFKSNNNNNNNTLSRYITPLFKNKTGFLQTFSNVGFKHFNNLFFNSDDSSNNPCIDRGKKSRKQYESTFMHAESKINLNCEKLFGSSNNKKLESCFKNNAKIELKQKDFPSLCKNSKNKENLHGIQVVKNIEKISNETKKAYNICNHNTTNLCKLLHKSNLYSSLFKYPAKPNIENIADTKDHLSSLYNLAKLIKITSTRFTQSTNDRLFDSDPVVEGYSKKANCFYSNPYASFNSLNNQHYFPESEISQFYYDDDKYSNNHYLMAQNKYDFENSSYSPCAEEPLIHGDEELSEERRRCEYNQPEETGKQKFCESFHNRNDCDFPDPDYKNVNQNSVRNYLEKKSTFEKNKRQLQILKLNEKRQSLRNIESYAKKLDKIIENLNEKKLYQKFLIDKLMINKNHNNNLKNKNKKFYYSLYKASNKNNSNNLNYLVQNHRNNTTNTATHRFSQANPSFQMPQKTLPKKSKKALKVVYPYVHRENPYKMGMESRNNGGPFPPSLDVKRLTSMPKTPMRLSGKNFHLAKKPFDDPNTGLSNKENQPSDTFIDCHKNSKILEKRIHRRGNGMNCVIMLPNKKTGAKNLMVCEEDENPRDWDSDDPFIFDLCPECRVKCCNGYCCRTPGEAACKCFNESEQKRFGIGLQNSNGNTGYKRSYPCIQNQNLSENNANSDDNYSYRNDCQIEGRRIQPLSMPNDSMHCNKQLFNQQGFTNSTKKVCPGCQNTMVQKSRRFVHIHSPEKKQVAYFQETCLFDSTPHNLDTNVDISTEASEKNKTKINPPLDFYETSQQTLQNPKQEPNDKTNCQKEKAKDNSQKEKAKDNSQKEKAKAADQNVKSVKKKQSSSESSSETESETDETSSSTSKKINKEVKMKPQKVKEVCKQDAGREISKKLNVNENQKVALKNAETNTDEFFFEPSQPNQDYPDSFNFQPHLSINQQEHMKPNLYEYFRDNSGQIYTEIPPPSYELFSVNQFCHFTPLNYPFMNQEPELTHLSKNSFVFPGLQTNFGYTNPDTKIF